MYSRKNIIQHFPGAFPQVTYYGLLVSYLVFVLGKVLGNVEALKSETLQNDIHEALDSRIIGRIIVSTHHATAHWKIWVSMTPYIVKLRYGETTHLFYHFSSWLTMQLPVARHQHCQNKCQYLLVPVYPKRLLQIPRDN